MGASNSQIRPRPLAGIHGSVFRVALITLPIECLTVSHRALSTIRKAAMNPMRVAVQSGIVTLAQSLASLQAFANSACDCRIAPMGASASDILRQPLFVLPQPVAAIHASFCHALPVTLHMRERPPTFAKDDFAIREAASGQLLFRVDCAALSVSDRKVLLDTQDQPIVHVRSKLVAFRHTLNISADYDSLQMLFSIKAHVMLSDASELTCEFRDVLTGAACRVGVVGNWRTRAALLWLDQGNGLQVPVARVYRPAPEARTAILGKHDYYVDIAPHMDAALIVLVCMALDESKNQ